MFKRNNKELSKYIQTKKQKTPKIKDSNKLATIIVFIILFLAFFGQEAYNIIKGLNLSTDDLFTQININEYIKNPFTETDFTNAKQKLSDVGLTQIANQYILSNFENNTQTPTTNLQLTKAEFESLIVPLYYSKSGKQFTIYEFVVSLFDSNSNLAKINICYAFNLKINLYNLNIDEIIYCQDVYQVDLICYDIKHTNSDVLNINKDYVKNEDIISNTDDMFNNFINYLFNKTDTSSLLNQLKFSNMGISEHIIELKI